MLILQLICSITLAVWTLNYCNLKFYFHGSELWYLIGYWAFNEFGWFMLTCINVSPCLSDVDFLDFTIAQQFIWPYYCGRSNHVFFIVICSRYSFVRLGFLITVFHFVLSWIFRLHFTTLIFCTSSSTWNSHLDFGLSLVLFFFVYLYLSV